MMSKFRQYFLTGLLTWLPMMVTVWVLVWLVGVFNGVFLGILGAAEAVLPGMGVVGDKLRQIPGLGVILVVVILLGTGLFVANIFGQWWLRQWSKVVNHIPVVRNIYSSVKQVSDTLFSGSSQAFSKAVLVQYPRQGAWTIAFLTGKPGGEVAGHLAGEHLSLYVPTTPNPTSGFFIMVPRADVIELRMGVDAALKYVISMGVVAPVAVDAPPLLPDGGAQGAAPPPQTGMPD
ncbi:MAG: DUF502 domain-containing protein [Burkholderiaceae bacterium]|jgi:uncharacterized membrane protein|nr:DUF502 domain-containing protein [Burkholderiaceae bacterium]